MSVDPIAMPALPAALLHSARAEFLAQGFAKANVGRIAAAAGMSKKTIYKYVPSKEALFLALLESVLSGPALMLEILDPAASPALRLTTYLRAFARLAFSAEGIMSYRLAMIEGLHVPQVARTYIDAVNRYSLRLLSEELAAHAAAGRMRIADPDHSAQMLLAMIVAVPLRDAALGLAEPPEGAALDERLNDAVATFLHGVSRETGG